MNVPIGGPGLDVCFDFHGCIPFLRNFNVGLDLQAALLFCARFQPPSPAFTFVLTFIPVFSFLEKLRLIAAMAAASTLLEVARAKINWPQA